MAHSLMLDPSANPRKASPIFHQASQRMPESINRNTAGFVLDALPDPPHARQHHAFFKNLHDGSTKALSMMPSCTKAFPLCSSAEARCRSNGAESINADARRSLDDGAGLHTRSLGASAFMQKA
jgi:hypothetical protein